MRMGYFVESVADEFRVLQMAIYGLTTQYSDEDMPRYQVEKDLNLIGIKADEIKSKLDEIMKDQRNFQEVKAPARKAGAK